MPSVLRNAGQRRVRPGWAACPRDKSTHSGDAYLYCAVVTFGGFTGSAGRPRRFRDPAVVVLACAATLVRTGVCGPRGRRTMGAMAALYCWRAAGRQTWRRAAAVVLVCGLLGAVALGALAGARRTDSAYGRYLASVRSSDVFVNVPGPSLAALRQVERLPGVRSAGACWPATCWPRSPLRSRRGPGPRPCSAPGSGRPGRVWPAPQEP